MQSTSTLEMRALIAEKLSHRWPRDLFEVHQFGAPGAEVARYQSINASVGEGKVRAEKVGHQRPPAIRELRENTRSAFILLLEDDVEMRRIICSMNAIRSPNAIVVDTARAVQN